MNHFAQDPFSQPVPTMQPPMAGIALGQSVSYPCGYDASLLFPIPRMQARFDIGITEGALPFAGLDRWNAYEMSWLNHKGLPQVALLRITVPCVSPNIIESKSFKLYLNSFNQTQFACEQDVVALLVSDLSLVAQARVDVELIAPSAFALERIEEFAGIDLDQQDIAASHYSPAPALLKLRNTSDTELSAADPVITESLYSRLLKSNCPVTQQPDWACVQIDYSGRAIDHAGLLQYIVSFRMHSGFHENCVERMYMDIMRQCQPQSLSIYARYTRRGGLDINPWRATPGMPVPLVARSARQ